MYGVQSGLLSSTCCVSSLKRFLWPTASKARCAICLRMFLTAGESLVEGSKSMKWQRQSQPYCVKTHRLIWKMAGASMGAQHCPWNLLVLE